MHFMSPLFILFSSMVAFIVFTIIFRKRTRKYREARIDKAFVNRRALDEASFYQMHFQKKDIPMYVVTGVRQVLENVLDADMARLTADDDFTTNLRFFFQADSLADVEIITELEEKFGIKLSDADAQRMTTVASIIDCVWSKEKQKARLKS